MLNREPGYYYGIMGAWLSNWVLGLQLWVPDPLHGCAVRVGAELSASQALPCCSQSVPSVSLVRSGWWEPQG